MTVSPSRANLSPMPGGKIGTVLARLHGVERAGEGWKATCPCHDDRHQSLSVGATADGTVLLHCHRNPPCPFEQIVAALSLTPRDLFAETAPRRVPRQIEAIYSYRDEDGQLLFQSVRYRPKAFTIRHPDGHGGWVWRRPARLVPYRLPELLAADPAEPVFVVEGEKAADRLAREGLVVTTSAMGASNWRDEYGAYFAGRRVVALPDEDDSGRAYAVEVAHSARNSGAIAVRVVELPGREEHEGADDWLDKRGGSVAALRERALGAPEWEPPPPSDPTAGQPPDRQFPMTDLGNAERLVYRHGANLRHCADWGRWLVWDGRRWKEDRTHQVMRLAKETVRAILVEAARASSVQYGQELARHALRSEDRRKITAMVALAAETEDGIPVEAGDLDCDPWLLNVENGTLDLRSGELRPHDPADGLTKLAPVAWDPAAECPRWLAFLDTIMAGNRALCDFLQRAVGYSLTGTIREHALLILYGLGANGKSTFLNTVIRLMGDYADTADPDLLLSKRHESHPTGLADVKGRRLVASIEVDQGRYLAESIVKTLTGGDRLKARRMRQDFFTFDPTHKLWLAVNHRPGINGGDDGIWRRVHEVPFTVTIPEEQQDKGLPDKLWEEASGILRWAVEGCLAWQREGLNPPPIVRAATDEYRRAMDRLAGFLDDPEWIVRGPNLRVGAKALYATYRRWAEQNGEKVQSQRQFGIWLTERKIERVRSGDKGQVEYIALAVSDRAVQDYHDLPLLAGGGNDETEGTEGSEPPARDEPPLWAFDPSEHSAGRGDLERGAL